ncbi:hypothetical protein DSO57_1007179 [Entomophthora muscae]|uniref:Uncharacterized protein n=1 Tax=Entomophthora muscae TaxID=34485 RepID=A0ACC2SWG3_9FUNG|nr:hypothetical protein DSO57_1007179 [Entomophthora muscae]
MLDHLGLLVPVVDSLITSFLTLATESLIVQWPALYLASQPSYFSDLPHKMQFLIPVLMLAFHYTNFGAKLISPSYQFGLFGLHLYSYIIVIDQTARLELETPVYNSI